MMNKIIILLCAVFAVAKGYEQLGVVDRIDDFLKIHNSQYKDLMQKYASTFRRFKEGCTERANVITVQSSFLIDKIVQTEQRLSPLELLSDTHNECVQTYAKSIQTVDSTRGDISKCVSSALNHLENLLSEANEIKEALKSHYEIEFKHWLEDCDTNYVKGTSNHTSCVTAKTFRSQEFFVQNQKDMQYALDAAECKAKEIIKKAVEDYYAIQYKIIASISKTNLLMNDCISSADECERCPEHSCDVSYPHVVDRTIQKLDNPFISGRLTRGCVVLEAQFN